MLTIRFELIYFVSQILVTKGKNRKDAPENFPKSKALGFLKAAIITTVCVLLKDFWKYRQIKISAKLIKIQFISGSLL